MAPQNNNNNNKNNNNNNKYIYRQNCYSSLAEMRPPQGRFATPGRFAAWTGCFATPGGIFATCTGSFATPSGIFATTVTAVLLPANDWLKGVFLHSARRYFSVFASTR